MSDDGLNRRRFLASGAVGVAASVSGCSVVLPFGGNSESGGGPPDASFAFEYAAAGGDSGGSVTITHDGGDGVVAGDLEVQTSDGDSALWSLLGSTDLGASETVEEGDRATIDATVANWPSDVAPDETVNVVYETDQTATTLSAFTPSDVLTATASPTATATQSGPAAIAYGDSLAESIDSGDQADMYFAEEGVFYADQYRFSATAGDTVEVTVSSDEFTPRLRLAGPDGSTVTTTESGSLSRQLEHSGEYRLWVTTTEQQATGSYTLSLSEIEGTPAPADLRSLSYGASAQGYIDEEDPVDEFYGGDNYAEPVTFQGANGDRVQITMRSDELDCWLRLESPDGETAAENDDYGSGTDARIETVFGADGEYTVWTGSFEEGQTGPYTLSLEKLGEAEDGPDLREIAVGETREGYVDLVDPVDEYYGDGYHAEPVTFDATGLDGVGVTMVSEAFNPWVRIEGPDGETLAATEDADDETETYVETALSQGGEHTVWCQTYDQNEAGSYTLTVEEVDDVGADQPDLRSITYGETATGYVDQSDPVDDYYDGTYYAEPVTFQGSAGDTVTITMESVEIDTFLRLEDPNGETVAENDDAEGTLNSEIVQELSEGGQYTIWARGVYEETTGSYTLTLEQGSTTDTPTGTAAGDGPDLRSIAYGETKDGFVDLDDPVDDYYSGDYHAEPVAFDGSTDDEIELTMASEDFDAWIRLEDPDEEHVTDADDGAGGTDALLTHTLEKDGEYTAWCQTYDEGETGDYTLTLEETS